MKREREKKNEKREVGVERITKLQIIPSPGVTVTNQL